MHFAGDVFSFAQMRRQAHVWLITGMKGLSAARNYSCM